MILLQTSHLARRFADVTLYEEVTFYIQSQDRVALVGRNGTGKSTLIRQIMGQEPISEGEISKARNLRIGYLEQHVAIDSDLSVWEEMLSVFDDTLKLRTEAEEIAQKVADLADNPDSPAYQEALQDYDRSQELLNQRNAYGIESEIRTVLHGFRFYEEDYDLPVQSLSGGQKTRLALARILLMDYDLLILDEPTNHLDMETLNWLEGYLQNYRGALLIVSHDRYFLNRVATKVIELRNHTAHLYKGNYDYYLKERALRMAQEMEAYTKQQDEIHRLEDFIQKNIVRASTTKRAQSRRKQLEKMVKIEKPRQDDKAPRIQFSQAKESGDRVIEASDLAIGYADEVISRQINMDLRKQEAIAIVGPNGVGKTTFLRTLIGQLAPLAGEVHYGSNVTVGYYDQNVNQLDGNLTVLETLWREQSTTDEWIIRSILGSFLFTGEAVEKNVAMLSGGEKARLRLAVLAMQHDNTLLLDEPTNHLDIDSKEVLEDALIEFDGTLLFVSHDRYFINRIASQVLEITPTGSKLYLGDYDYYLEKKAEETAIQEMHEAEEADLDIVQEPSQNQLSYEARKQVQREKRKLEKAVEAAWEANSHIEERIEAIHSEMIPASEANDVATLAALDEELRTLQGQQDEAINIWEETSLALEAFEEEFPGV
ncbi:multidrug ABC transporter ATP-binding protein [Suicoccus acidiformans]|uniref:Multidrug ABC transporter ATP-binding protein n=1 Tax=Suicoccus acidiformans TaxID=2036206 RepID=A0A347WHX6_9LACT|nr:ABC-F family ATP-binding cassette domain-containing protein [Suicoccus acidiformans]AXY24683.1 multidrug ABC transporter ATP-binding protein [Suicoccus acidiformans]